MQQLKKKGQVTGVINTLLAAAIGVAVLAILYGVSSDVLDSVQDSQTASGFAYNASDNGLRALANMADDTGTLGTVIIAGALISIVGAAFAFGRR